MSQTTVDAKTLRSLAVQNQLIPKEGPIVVPLLFDFTAFDTYVVDLEQRERQNKISMVQAVYIDLSTTGIAMVVNENTSNQDIVANGRTQGFYNLLSVNPTKISFTLTGGPTGIKIFLLNFPIAGVVWTSTHP